MDGIVEHTHHAAFEQQDLTFDFWEVSLIELWPRRVIFFLRKLGFWIFTTEEFAEQLWNAFSG